MEGSVKTGSILIHVPALQVSVLNRGVRTGSILIHVPALQVSVSHLWGRVWHTCGVGLRRSPQLECDGGYRWVYGYHGRNADLLYLHLMFIQAVEKNTHAT